MLGERELRLIVARLLRVERHGQLRERRRLRLQLRGARGLLGAEVGDRLQPQRRRNERSGGHRRQHRAERAAQPLLRNAQVQPRL